MQPNQERLLTFAMDLGVEVRPEVTVGNAETTGIEASLGHLVVSSRSERKTAYSSRSITTIITTTTGTAATTITITITITAPSSASPALVWPGNVPFVMPATYTAEPLAATA